MQSIKKHYERLHMAITCLQSLCIPLYARMLLGTDINAAMQRANQPEVKHSQLSYCNSRASINNVGIRTSNQLAAPVSPDSKGNRINI